MFKVIATDVVVSKGYDNTPALKFSDRGDSVRFRIGKKVYDTRAKDNHRWVNLSAKAFGPVCERIRKMQLRDGSFVNILGRLDEDTWEDSTTHEKRSAIVVILDEITDITEPGITSMDVDTYELGVQTAEILISQIENPEASIRQVLLSTRVVERDSTKRRLK